MSKRKRLTLNSNNMTTLLIDGDILLYRVGFTTEDVSEDIAKVRMNSYIDEILHNSFCSDYRIFLTGSGNFRKELYGDYKANRKQEKPKHYQALKDYLIQYEKAELQEGQEADDALGINQTDTTIIASTDKDLNQIPGRHYNFVKDEHYEISEEEGLRFLYTQILTGDSTDNIKGIKGIGPKKAEKILEGCKTEEDYKRAVLEAYRLDGKTKEDAELVGKLVYIRRKEGELWNL